ncbi:eCIS core domain-containing protein [Deinococcus aquaedulcis]|uniref:eCIS core domain-containing protein n=1 Tax=Deinococcus aquaedulcis TaxID=2840455 RepID=UPI001C83EFA3|nr:DUF4157 domain-containing protein [Deinococcus aquaedulcis]
MGERLHRQHPAGPTAARRRVSEVLAPAPDLATLKLQRLAQELRRLNPTSTVVQRQAAGPVLRASGLAQQEVARLAIQRQAVSEQLAALPQVEGVAVQQQAQPVPAKPQSPADWVTVMRHQAQQVEGQALDTRQYAQFTALQRQVANTLVQGFRADRGPAQARYDTYGEHLATLQRHEISAPVSRVVLGLVPAGERLALQRAVDTAAQRYEAEAAVAATLTHRQTLQRQLAELDAEATQPVLQRIQARRGAGNPLPEAIQRHLEQGLNHDLSRVRIHDDAEADTLAKGVNALAFTTGSDIFFQSGKFNPNSQSGLELLAHEVTHTVQQSQGRVGPGVDPDAGLESEARTMGAKLAQGPRFGTQHARHRPGALTQVRSPQPLQRLAEAPTIQRWFNPLDKLKELKKKAKAAVKQVVRTVTNPAARKAALNTLKRKLPAPIRATIKKAAKKVGGVRAGLGKGMAAARGAVKRAGETLGKRLPRAAQLLSSVGQLSKKARAAVSQVATRVGRTARQLGTAKGRAQLVKQAKAGLHRTLRAAAKSLPAPAQKALKGLAKTGRAAVQNLQNLGLSAAKFATDPAYRGKALKRLAQTPMVKQIAQVGGNIHRFTTDKAYRGEQLARMAQAGKRITMPLQQLAGSIGKLGKDAVVAVVQKSKQAMTWANAKWEQVKKSQVGQAVAGAWKWVRSPEGAAILAKFGASIAVGVGVVAVIGTGGAALPLVLAAAGMASGVAGSLAETAVLKSASPENYKNRKWSTGITASTLAVDGLLGAFLGPAARVVGGGVARGVGSALKYVGGAGQVVGKVAGAGWQGVRSTAARLAGNRAARVGNQASSIRQEIAQVWQATRQGVQQYNQNIVASVRAGVRHDMLGNAGWRGIGQRDVGTLLAGTDVLRQSVNRVARAQVKAELNRPMGLILARHRLNMPGASAKKIRQALFNELKANPQEDLIAAAWKANPQLRRAAYSAARGSMWQQVRQGFVGNATTVGGKAGMMALTGPRLMAANIQQKSQAFLQAFTDHGLAGGIGQNVGSVAEELTKFAGLKFSLNVKANSGSKDEQTRRQAIPLAMGKTADEFGKVTTYGDAALQSLAGIPPELLGKPGMLPTAMGFDTVLKYLGSSLGNVIGGDLHEITEPDKPDKEQKGVK